MTTQLFDLKGKVAIVTGGNGGIGLGMARGLADAGADIAVVGRNEAKSAEAVEDLRKRGVKAIAVATDVTDKAAVSAMIERVGTELGRIDILVNNAGTSIRKPTHLLELDEWHTVMDTNLTSAFLCSKAAYPALKASGRGKVINIGSMMSIFAGSYAPAYAASKGGIVQFSRSCACAWAEDNIQVNAILPGWIDTGFDQGRAPAGGGTARAGAGAHARGALGRDRRLRGDRGIPRLARIRFRHGSCDPRRWRILGDVLIAV